MIFGALFFLTTAMPGGFSPVSDIDATSKVHQLADFSLRAVQRDVCAASNSLTCSRLNGASLHRVVSARQQVVSGMNYEIVGELDSGATLTLRVYEQAWTSTLVLKSASLTAAAGGASLAITTLGNAIEEGKELALDAEAFNARLAAAQEISMPTVGGYRPLTEVGPTSKAHQLAAFSLQSMQSEVCAASNSLACGRLQGATIARVVSAKQKTVSGMQYEIICETDAGLQLTLRVYEQPWTSTLSLDYASLTAPVGGASLAVVTLGNVLEEGKNLALDSAAFNARLDALSQEPQPVKTDSIEGAAPAEKPGQCTGGMVFNECGSPCTKTCDEPSPICAMMCVAKCECPRDTPILKDGQCVAFSECAAAQPAVAAACKPNPAAPCPRIYMPVCADGQTYANDCLAKADCKDKFTLGECGELRSTRSVSPFLIGGAPISSETRGGHYTGSDQALFSGQQQGEQPEETILLDRTTAAEKQKYNHGQQAIGVVTLVMALMLIFSLGAFLVSRNASHRRNTDEATPMATSDAQDSLGVRMEHMPEVKANEPKETPVMTKP